MERLQLDGDARVLAVAAHPDDLEYGASAAVAKWAEDGAQVKAGDVIATTDGLVAYTGVRVGNEQSFDFTPVASYPGLTAAVRARLGEMKVAPVSAELASDAPLPETGRDVAPSSVAPKGNAAKSGKRAEAN